MDNTIFAIITAFFGYLIKDGFDRRSDLRARKIPIYIEVLEAIQPALHLLKTEGAVALDPKVSAKVVTWGSIEIVVAYATLRQHLTSQQPNNLEIRKAMGQLLAGIRKDLGHGGRQAPRFDELTGMLFSADAVVSNLVARTPVAPK
ncbi:MAG TPA: hypothetical protein VEQ40_00130 [Pyrinomonadaceae bacterium]|nr:hypothetical protein [Pyrinomonadaceae bacterium]